MNKLIKLEKYSIISIIVTAAISAILSLGVYINIIKHIDNVGKIISMCIYMLLSLSGSITTFIYLYKNKNNMLLFSIIFLIICDALLIYYAYKCAFVDCMLVSSIKMTGMTIIYTRTKNK